MERLVCQIRAVGKENWAEMERLHTENPLQFTDPPNINKSFRVWFKKHCGCV